jgi:uncharacterized protein YndB with AHSA1/START domain
MARVSFKTEFLFKASPNIIHKFLTTTDCLIRWFCDACYTIDDTYVFSWDGNEEMADLLDDFEEELVRFRWKDADKGEYLEFKISESEVTGETIMYITAFAEEDEVEEERKYWENAMESLRRATGGG